MRTKRPIYLVGDFETTVYDNQEFTEVWASAIVELNTEDVKIMHSINETWDYLASQKRNLIIYYHNLKFDGQFWLSFFMRDDRFNHAIIDAGGVKTFKDIRDMKSGDFIYSISDMGQWYKIVVKNGVNYIEFRDSLKLLPFSVRDIGKSFKTKHQKLDMEYKGFRYAGCNITNEEAEYIANDVLVIKEALEFMFEQNHKELTIGSCCLKEYKNSCIFQDMDKSLPNMYDIPIDETTFGSKNAGEYIRQSYKGGWCYLVPEKANKRFANGTTADVNSLYPSMMHSMSGNCFPVGKPIFWTGNYIPEEAERDGTYYFIRIRTMFNIKKDRLPCIQIKNSLFYKPTEWLNTSDIFIGTKGKRARVIDGIDGSFKKAHVVLTLTMIDYKLICDQYDLYEFEILDGCYFRALQGIFDEYIDKYMDIKTKSSGAMRQLAKLFLNNLYGKMATSPDSSFKVAFVKEDGALGYTIVQAHDKKPGYIPIGSAITSYARNFTIRAAQANYNGPGKPGFIYADTDSIHCDIEPTAIKGIIPDPVKFCCWKLESCWDDAVFIRQKTYAEHICAQELKPIVEPYWDIKCAGMPDRSKKLLLNSFNPDTKNKLSSEEYLENYNEDELTFLSETRTIADFKVGLIVPGKLKPRTINGGVVLDDIAYEIRQSFWGEK